MTCPRGQIMREAFTRKNGTKVPATCVKDRGLAGKGPKTLPKPKKSGMLTKYGYSLDKSATVRHSALNKAIAHDSYLEVLRHLNLIRNITATDSKNKQKLTDDLKYIIFRNTKISKSKSKSTKSKSRTKSRK